MNLDGNDIINIFQSIQDIKHDQIDQLHYKEAYDNLFEQLYLTCLKAVSEQPVQDNVWVSIHFSSIQLLLVQASLKTYRLKLHHELCDIQTNGRACDGLADDVLSVHTTIKKVGGIIQQKEEIGLELEPSALLE